MAGAFERLAKSVLARLGEDALLISGANSTPCRVNVERGVQIMGSFDDAVFERDTATFDKGQVTPVVGDVLQHPQGNFKLDGKVQDTGYTMRFTMQQMP